MSWRSPIVAEGNYLMGFKTLQGRKQHKKPSGYRNGREMELHSLAGKQIYKYFKLRIDGKFIYIYLMIHRIRDRNNLFLWKSSILTSNWVNDKSTLAWRGTRKEDMGMMIPHLTMNTVTEGQEVLIVQQMERAFKKHRIFKSKWDCLSNEGKDCDMVLKSMSEKKKKT